MEQDDVKGRGEAKAAFRGVIRNAAAIHFVMLVSLLAAGMLFAITNLVIIMAVVVSVSLAIWGVAALILLPFAVVAFVEWLRGGPPSDPLHDPWLDEQGEGRA